MTSTLCPTLGTDPAVLFASGGYATFMNLAPRTFDEALRMSETLGNFAVTPISFNATFNFEDQLTPFRRPARPELDMDAFDFHAPAAPGAAPVFIPQNPTLTPAPEFNTPDPNVIYGPRPNVPVVVEPIAPARPDALVIPEAPDIDLPPLPTFVQLNLPSVPQIDLPEFSAERPVFVEPSLGGNFGFTPGVYTSDMKAQLVAKLSTWMQGQEALPPQIEEALFGRGRERVDLETRRSIEERVGEFANRGFTEPGGALAASIDSIIRNGLDRKAEFARETSIKSFDEALANTRLAVQQGIAYEQIAVNLFIEEQRLTLAAAQNVRDTALAIYAAKREAFVARLDAYRTDATVFAERIRALLSRVELYKAQIEGEKAKGEINEQRTRIYAEQVRALSVTADLYRAQVDGVRAQAEANKTVFDAFRAEVEAYEARWSAYGKEVDAYRSQIEAENSKVTVHRNLVDAFATRTQAWGTEANNKIALERLRVDQHGQRLQAWRGDLDRMLALIQAETARIGATAQGTDAQARIYQADAAVESAASAAADRTFELGLNRENARVNTALRAAEIRIQENVQLTQVLLEARRTLTQVLSNLASAAMSAMNFSASVSSSRSDSKACSTSYTWSGEAPDLV